MSVEFVRCECMSVEYVRLRVYECMSVECRVYQIRRARMWESMGTVPLIRFVL